MARVAEYHIPRYGAKRVLVLAKDRRLGSRLHSEFQLAGGEVVSESHLRPGDRDRLATYDIIVVDSALLPPSNRVEWLRSLPLAAPSSRFVLLLAPQEQALREQAPQIGFHLVRERPTGAKALAALVRESLGEPALRTEAVPVAMDFAFLLESAKGRGRRGAGSSPRAETVPVSMDFEFLLENSKRARRRWTGNGSRVEGVAVPTQLRFLTKQTDIAGRRRTPQALTALGVHGLALVVALGFPLWQTDTIEVRQLTHTRLLAPPLPPPPPPPPPAPSRARLNRRPKRVQQALQKSMLLPTAIPKKVVPELDAPPVEMEEIADFGIASGVPGGVPGGQVGGVLGGVLAGIPAAAPPVAAAEPTPQGPIRVGGEVRRPRLLKHVVPIYPPLARRARLRGTVCIDAIIDTDGRIVEMNVLHGHPLLATAAMNAVRQWVYEPTYLNGQPVPLAFGIKVNFNLGDGQRFEVGKVRQAQGGDSCRHHSVG